MDRITLFQIPIDRVTMAEAVLEVCRLARGKAPTYVVTPNVDHVVKLQKDQDFFAIYQKAALSLADGMPLVWVSRWAGKPLPERVTGADLFLEVCRAAADQGLRVYLLGSATQAIVETAAQQLVGRFPGLRIVGAVSPSFGFEKNDAESQDLIRAIRAAQPDILFVGVGAPKQEKWVARYLTDLHVPVSLGVGASFDFVAGSVKRAPVWMQKTGLEWFYRFLKEPRRMFQRYFIDDFVFFGLAWKEWRETRKAVKASGR